MDGWWWSGVDFGVPAFATEFKRSSPGRSLVVIVKRGRERAMVADSEGNGYQGAISGKGIFARAANGKLIRDMRSRRTFILATLAAEACRTTIQRGRGIDAVFRGFTYVGGFASDDLLLNRAQHRAMPLPGAFAANLNYVFHLDHEVDFEHLATVELPNRLRTAGASVIDAPRTWRDMAVPNSGNPRWQIEFKSGTHVGLIENRHDPARLKFVVPRGGPDARTDDYILRFVN